MAFQPGDLETPGVPNPRGLLPRRGLAEPFDTVFDALWIVVVLVGIGSLAVCFWYASPEQRRQIEWLGYAPSPPGPQSLALKSRRV